MKRIHMKRTWQFGARANDPQYQYSHRNLVYLLLRQSDQSQYVGSRDSLGVCGDPASEANLNWWTKPSQGLRAAIPPALPSQGPAP